MSWSPFTTAWKFLSRYSPSFPKPADKNHTLLPVSSHDSTDAHPRNSEMANRHNLGSPAYPQRSITKRTIYGSYGCTIFGWPSTGGVIIRENADLVELQYLGIDPLNPPISRDTDQEKEDEFCAALRKIGGKLWRSEQRKINVRRERWYPSNEPTEEELREVYIGWPQEGGVLVFEDDESFIPGEIGMLRMISSMEDRCQLLRDKFQATYYKHPRDYPHFSILGPGRNEAPGSELSDGTKKDY